MNPTDIPTPRTDATAFHNAQGEWSDANDARSLEREIVRLKEENFCPGVWCCPKCGFTLFQNKPHTQDGTISANTDSVFEVCPNDMELMNRVTWKERVADIAKSCESQVARAVAAEANVAELTAENTRLKALLAKEADNVQAHRELVVTIGDERDQLQSKLTATEKELEEVKKWKEEDPRMLREQIRVSDVAYQSLFERNKVEVAERDQLISELTSALKNWINYFQADVPITAQTSQEQGDLFTQYWFETEQALSHAIAVLKEGKE